MSAAFESYEAFYRATYPSHIQDVRMSATGATMLNIAQPPGDFSDAPVPDLVLTLVRSPSARATLDFGAGASRALLPRDSFVLVPPATAARILVDEPHAILILALEGLRAAALTSQPTLDFGALHCGQNVDPVVALLVDTLYRDGQDESPTGALFADSAVATLVARLDHLASRGAPRRRVHAGGLGPRCLKRVMALMADRLGEDVPLAMLAAEAGLSPFHFARAFRTSTGLPPHRWLVAQRMARAQQLLAGGTLSVGDVAAAVGYADPGHFAKLFRRETGLAPAAWRRERLR
ncbi:helix-turn-helix domain-containing protein [Falsiroseomonas sp. E2-1-a20]|uniref:helix-turn-helix domain-containing protein n=1 Tax=Falsiroseomonas sp. E2-1-a20 TaxID=3239300 RepID=UPI003F302C54